MSKIQKARGDHQAAAPRSDLVTPSEFRPVQTGAAAEISRSIRFVDAENDIVVSRKPPTVLGIDIDGKPTTNATTMAAKRIADDFASPRCYVRVSVGGADRGGIADPRGGFFNLSDFLNGEKRYAFAEVSSTVFDAYVKYLETGHSSNLRTAERLRNDG